MKTEMNFGIPMPDGIRLSARVWIPDTAESEPVPAILEYLPYRKTDGTIDRDETMHPWFAEHGYACLRVDRRGCGESEGLYDDEYSEQELQDGEHIIAWIAAQPWCNGNVGMQGISWGGFNGLQIAARRPEALKAVISIGTTVNRYTDDIHYKGGIQLGENLGWAATSASWFSMPPDPAQAPNWRETWLDRLDSAPFLAERWTRESDRGAYWKHGSVCETYDAFDAAILVIGGQHDGYRNAMAEMLEHASGTVQAILGPWGHKYPHISTIGPSIDYLNLALRWWDRWLKGVENGAEADPAYRVYVMDSIKPDPALAYRPGKWLGIDQWPSNRITTQTLPFGDGTLGAATPFTATVDTITAVGRATGEFFPFGFGPGELPDDQSIDDQHCLTFDSAVLPEDTTLIGAPSVQVQVSSNQPKAQMIVRLSDVRPDGTVTLISMGLLNLRHRDGFAQKVDLEPDTLYDVTIQLDQCAYNVPKGHQLRVAVSGSYWPYCWPEGEVFQLTLTKGTLTIPVQTGEFPETSFDPAQPIARRPSTQLSDGVETKEWTTSDDGQIELKIVGDHGQREDLGTGLITHSKVSEHWSIDQDDPAKASVVMVWTRGLGRGDWDVRSEVTTSMHGRKDTFEITETVKAWDGGELVFQRTRTAKPPR